MRSREIAAVVRGLPSLPALFDNALVGAFQTTFRGQLKSVSLAVNSRDAMPGDGRLTIETADLEVDDEIGNVDGLPKGRYVQLKIVDTGTGMDQHTLDHMFEPFFKTVDGAAKTSVPGLSNTIDKQDVN